ncbi:MAG: ABC transporter permease, partial [Dehalococcoidia bacterium]
MQKYILNRLLQSIVVLFIVGLIVFALGRATGNPAELLVPDDATEDEIQFIEQQLGLDRPYHIQ